MDARAWGRAARTTAVALVVLGAANVLLARLRPVPLYSGWENQQVEAKVTGYRQFTQARGGASLLLLGSSVVQTIDLARFEKSRPALSVYNGGIGGVAPQMALFLWEHAFVPAGVPDALVYVVGPRSLRDLKGRKAFPLRGSFYQSARARALLATAPVDRLEVYLERGIYLLRARRSLRHLVSHGHLPEPTTISVNASGVRPHLGGVVRVESYPSDYFYRSRYDRYEVNDEAGEVEALRRLLERADRAGVVVALVISPLAPAAMSLFDDPQRDYGLFRDALIDVARQRDVLLFDMHHELKLPNAAFDNPDHVNARGARVVEDYLATRVLPAVLAPRVLESP